MRSRVGTRIPEKLRNDELQKKLSENIKNLGDIVTKKNAEEKIKEYAGAFSDKAKNLADSARQKTEGIYKSEAATGMKAAATLSEKITDLKDKVAESARDLTEQAKEKIDSIRAPHEAEPEKDEPVKTESVEIGPSQTSTPEPVNSDLVPPPAPATRKTRARAKSPVAATKSRATKASTRTKSSTSADRSRTKPSTGNANSGEEDEGSK